MRLQRAVELVEHDAGLHDAPSPREIDVDDAGEIFRTVEHQRFVYRLAGLRSASAARQHDCALVTRKSDGTRRPLDVARRYDSDRHHLIVRRIGGVTPARKAIEPYVPG